MYEECWIRALTKLAQQTKTAKPVPWWKKPAKGRTMGSPKAKAQREYQKRVLKLKGGKGDWLKALQPGGALVRRPSPGPATPKVEPAK